MTAGLALWLAATGVRAQETPGPFTPPIAGGWEPVQSMGQPPRWKPFVTLGFGADRRDAEVQVGPTGGIGVYRDLLNPLFGLLGASTQVYGGQRGEHLDGGVRAYLGAPAFFLHAGADWNVSQERVDFILSANVPTTRGGWFRRGGELRVDWVPARGPGATLGVTLPVGQPHAGRTRPRQVDVPMPVSRVSRRPPRIADGATYAAIVELHRTMRVITSLHNIFWVAERGGLDQRRMIEDTRAVLAALREELAAGQPHLPGQHTYALEIEDYHRNLERAFGLALGGSGDAAAALGRPLAERARQIALDEVLIPYNRTVGRYKQPDTLAGLIARARARFEAWAQLAPELRPAQSQAAVQVFDAWINGFELLRDHLARLTNDSRMHWLPLAFVLREEEHTTQAQIDAIVERALGREFSGGNAMLYLNARQFQTELMRTIHETASYHVLWIHDYRGRTGSGAIDRTGFSQTAHGYMRALLDRVRSYDHTGTLPTYIMMLDQHYYELNDSRVWLDLLERPLDHRLRGPGRDIQETVAALQDSLRAAVAASRRLQAEAAAFGPQWITRVLKVHVNVTNPSDFTFRSDHLLGLRFGADNLMRDHRKLVIRDITETDPAAGEVILTGVGVGDAYTSERWEDRGVILQGPAALEAKRMARQVLETNGMRGDALPRPLRPLPYALDYASRTSALEAAGATARALQTHNRTGWGDKDATFVQMLLYDLVPPGTVVYVPDSLWGSYEWLAQLVSAALRGCRVYVVAPAPANAPSAGFPQMAAMHELLTRLTIVEEQLRPMVAEAGGELRIGLYTRRAAMDDVPARIAEVDATFRRYDFLERLFPLSPEAAVVLHGFHGAAAPPAADPARAPLMHRKTQLLISGALLAQVAAAPALPTALRQLLAAEGEALVLPAASGLLAQQARLAPSLAMIGLWDDLPRDVLASSVAYFMVGSPNKDVRSMALDGEALAVVAGAWTLQAFLDFLLLSGAVTWVADVEELHALAPPYSRFQLWIGRLLHRIL